MCYHISIERGPHRLQPTKPRSSPHTRPEAQRVQCTTPGPPGQEIRP
nr:MAG TPA: hypothetical protein [Caudoviricetes sp.]